VRAAYDSLDQPRGAMVGRGDLPDGVRGPDGRTEPFEPERIARSLFAAAGRIGRADAFLARELTEGVLHFLTADAVGAVPTPKQVVEVVVKVVRELGQPALANAYEENCSPRLARATRPHTSPTGTAGSSLPTIANAARRGVPGQPIATLQLSDFFPRDLVSAHEEGLIRLSGGATPLQLSGVSAGLPSVCVFEGMQEAHAVAGEFVVVDGPEFELASREGEPAQLAQDFVDETRRAAAAFGLSVYFNLNISSPPTHLAEGAGPLFPPTAEIRSERIRQIADELAVRADDDTFFVWWHVSDGENARGDPVVPRRTANTVEFVFDRAKAPVQLGPGIDRRQPAALIQIGVNLAQLVQMTGGPPVAADVFLRRVGSLARFAKTAGHVKQDYLRCHGQPAVREAFLLDRASLVFVPLGLAEASRSTDRPPAEFAREILRTLRSAAENDRPRILPVRIDCGSWPCDWGAVADPNSTLRQKVRLGSQLHSVTGAGCLDLVVNGGVDRGDVLRLAAESSVARLRFRSS